MLLLLLLLRFPLGIAGIATNRLLIAAAVHIVLVVVIIVVCMMLLLLLCGRGGRFA